MSEHFEPLPDDSRILRFCKKDGAFLPDGRVLPLPEWLAPTTADKEEARQRGRVAGLTVWDLERATVAQARALAKRADDRAFTTRTRACREVGRDYSLVVTVVRDPIDSEKPQVGWDAHALIEGLSCPKGANKDDYRLLRATLVDRFESV